MANGETSSNPVSRTVEHPEMRGVTGQAAREAVANRVTEREVREKEDRAAGFEGGIPVDLTPEQANAMMTARHEAAAGGKQ